MSRLFRIYACTSLALLALLASVRPASAQCLINEVSKLRPPSGQSLSLFGQAVAMSESTAAIGGCQELIDGAPVGTVHVYRPVNDTWTEEARLVAPDAAPYSNFGWAVAVGDDRIFVGAYLDDEHGVDSGAVYVFQRLGETWSVEAKLAAPDSAPAHYFGHSLASADDVLVVGAIGDTARGSGAGAAYVFRRGAAGWMPEAKLVAADGAPGDAFGRAVALTGSMIAVGAYLADDDGDAAGCAYVFEFDGTAWTQRAKLRAWDGAPHAWFGRAVAAAPGRIVIGAVGASGTAAHCGAAYVFQLAGTTWQPAAKLLAADAASYDRFGSAVTVTSDRILIGAERAVGRTARAGAAYAFGLADGTWTQQAKLCAFTGNRESTLGGAVALAGTKGLLGAARDDSLLGSTGMACFFDGLGDCNTNGLPDACDLLAGTSRDCDGNGVPDECEVSRSALQNRSADGATQGCLRGDANCDQTVNFGDIDAFVLAILSPAEYHAQYPHCSPLNADCNCDGAANAHDIDPFVACIQAGGCECP